MRLTFRPFIYGLIILSVTALSGCNFFAPPAQPLDLIENNPAATEMAALRATATVEADRMMITMEAVNTAIREVDVQSTRIASTLVARGTPFVDTSMITPLPPNVGNFESGSVPAVNDPNIVPIITPGGGAQGNAALTPANPPPAVIGTPTPLPGANNAADPSANQAAGALLSQITVSRGVGADDCPTGATDTFTTADTDIYVSAVAQVLAGSNIRATFTRDGAEVVAYDWSPTFDINGACIWFHMPASAVPYVAGAWSASLSVNGTPVGSTNFTIQ